MKTSNNKSKRFIYSTYKRKRAKLPYRSEYNSKEENIRLINLYKEYLTEEEYNRLIAEL